MPKNSKIILMDSMRHADYGAPTRLPLMAQKIKIIKISESAEKEAGGKEQFAIFLLTLFSFANNFFEDSERDPVASQTYWAATVHKA